MLLVKRFSFLEELLAEPKICNLQHTVIHEYVLRLDVAMYDIVLIEILEGVKDLLEVSQDILLFSYPALAVKYPEVIIQILVIAVLQNKVDPVIFGITHHVLDFDDVGVVP